MLGTGIKAVYHITGTIDATTAIANEAASIGATLADSSKAAITNISWAACGTNNSYNARIAAYISSTTEVTVYASSDYGTISIRYCIEVTEYY